MRRCLASGRIWGSPTSPLTRSSIAAATNSPRRRPIPHDDRLRELPRVASSDERTDPSDAPRFATEREPTVTDRQLTLSADAFRNRT